MFKIMKTAIISIPNIDIWFYIFFSFSFFLYLFFFIFIHTIIGRSIRKDFSGNEISEFLSFSIPKRDLYKEKDKKKKMKSKNSNAMFVT